MNTQRSYSSLPSDDGAHYDGSLRSTHTRPGHQPHLHIETAPTFQRDGYTCHSGSPVVNGTLGQYASRNSTSYNLQSNSPHISYNETTFAGAAQAGPFSYLFPQDGSPGRPYDMLASPQLYHPSPTYTSAPHIPPRVQDTMPTPNTDYAPASYGQSTRAPSGYPSGTASSNVSHLYHAAPMLAHHALYSDHIHEPDLPRCEWDGCNQLLGDNSCAGVRRHLRDYHYKGKPPSAKDSVECKWGGSCRRDPMQWENIPKHISECHTKTMQRECELCGDSFARSDTLKRHKEAGNCSRSNLR